MTRKGSISIWKNKNKKNSGKLAEKFSNTTSCLFNLYNLRKEVIENAFIQTVGDTCYEYRQKKELKANGVNRKDKEAVKAYFDAKEAEAKAKAEQEAKEAEEKAKADRLANPTTEDLLKDIKELLAKQVK